jgi:colicin import membrane protein
VSGLVNGFRTARTTMGKTSKAERTGFVKDLSNQVQGMREEVAGDLAGARLAWKGLSPEVKKSREEADRKARMAAEQKARADAEFKAREEAERKAKATAELRAKEEAERQRLEQSKKRAKDDTKTE